jgi:hypothetical protein
MSAVDRSFAPCCGFVSRAVFDVSVRCGQRSQRHMQSASACGGWWLGKAKTSHVCYNTILKGNTYFATRTGVGSLAICGRRNTIRSTASSALSFASLALVVLHHWCRREVANRG